MNLQLINTGLPEQVIWNFQNRTRGYTDFIDSAIELLKRESISIRVEKKVVDVHYQADGEPQTRKEVRYYPVEPKTHREERARDLLFEEYTKRVFFDNKNFKIQHASYIESRNQEEEYIQLSVEFPGGDLFIQPETYQLVRQKQAIDNLRFSPLAEHEPLLRLFSNSGESFWDRPKEKLEVKDWYILTDESVDGIFEQREFVEKALQSPDFALMEGPPGSGKTTAIIELIIQYALIGKRVLLCSATHAAIDNVFERVKGKYSKTCEQYIVPVRISSEVGPVKENVKPFLLKNLVETYKSKFKTFLSANNRRDSQRFLKETIAGSDQIIDKLILESANLVGGTTIGILQHPDIANNVQGVPFDVLIIDEASKVTFQDFIVPALYAKKWILVGDVKQLSPYVEDDYVAEYIDEMIKEPEQKNMLADHYELRLSMAGKQHKESIKVFFTERDPNEEMHFIMHYTTDQEVIVMSDDMLPGDELMYQVNGADIIVCKNTEKSIRLLFGHLCSKAIFINKVIEDERSLFEQQFFHQPKERFCFDTKGEGWSGMVARRLNQSFSFRFAGNEFSNIDRQLELLLPEGIEIKRAAKNGVSARTTTLRNEIDELRRLVFPSILELLQKGNGKLVTYNKEGEKREDQNSVISSGWSKKALKNKFTALSYQHRMEPEIAKTSKDNFYTETDGLKPSKLVTTDRGWRYKKDEVPVIWITNAEKTGNHQNLQMSDKNRESILKSSYLKKKFGNRPQIGSHSSVGIINLSEADHIEKELRGFIEWAKINPWNPDEDGKRRNYEVAVLTFYLNQQSILKERIRNLTGQHNHHSKFVKDNVDIFLYTVDKFQGQEADMVLLGFTKYTGSAHYNSPNRLNVALTRARHKLILFGNRAWFEQNARLKAIDDLATNFKPRLIL